ncbi:NAD(P) transhydrogenase, alpha subunit part 2 family protein [Bacteroidales bacterium KA00251]|nr:NAD(P) transhydrogenase, alpha subunit part 2 family protein [Bacteroidales bacterium KA00251]
MIHPLILVLVFVVATVLGYFIISKVPALLHTPLMSGMNALSGITIIGALSAAALSFLLRQSAWGQVLAAVAIVLAMINVVGGFGVTHRMLKMFKSGSKQSKEIKK